MQSEVRKFPAIIKEVGALFGKGQAMVHHRLAVENLGMVELAWQRIRHGITVNGERARAHEGCRRRCPLNRSADYQKVVESAGEVEAVCTGFPRSVGFFLARLDMRTVTDTDAPSVDQSEIPCGVDPVALYAELKKEPQSSPFSTQQEF